MDPLWCTRLSHWKDGEPLEGGLICYENPRTTILGISRIALPLSGGVEAMSFKNQIMGKYGPRNWFYKVLKTVDFFLNFVPKCN